MKIIYPATIEKITNQYYLEFPDLSGCQTWGNSLEEVLDNAIEALEGYILTLLENDINIPKASDLSATTAPENGEKTYICCNIEIKSTTPIKKTLTIPQWVNKLGVENNINFSQTLTEAIIKQCKLNATHN